LLLQFHPKKSTQISISTNEFALVFQTMTNHFRQSFKKLTSAQDISSDKCLGGALKQYRAGIEYCEGWVFCDDCPLLVTVRKPACVGDVKFSGKLNPMEY
jgi:hypothetical protein